MKSAQSRDCCPGLLDSVRPLSPRDRKSLENLPHSDSAYRKQSKLLDGVSITGGPGSVYEKMWHRPSIAVNAIEAGSRKQAANIINDVAWARVGVRIVPDMDPHRTRANGPPDEVCPPGLATLSLRAAIS